MKKIIIMLALLFGVALQAQDFDFECPDDGPNFGVVGIKVKIAGEEVAPLGLVHLEKHESFPDVLVDATTISLNEGYEVGSKIFYAPYENYPGVPGLQYYFDTREVGTTNVRVSVRAQSAFDFTQPDFTMDLTGISQSFTSAPDEVTVRARIADDIYHDFVFVEGDDLTVGHSIPLPEGFSLKKAIPAQDEYQLNSGEPQVRSRRSYRTIDSENIGLRLQITLEHWTFGLPEYKKYQWKGYDQEDLEIDLREDFEAYIALPDPDEVTVKVRIADDLYHDFVFVEGASEELGHSIPLTDEYQLKKSIPQGDEWVVFEDDLQIRTKVSYRAVDSENVGLRLRIDLEHAFGLDYYEWNGYDQDDFEIDLRHLFNDYIEEADDFGSLGLLLNDFDPNGTPASIGNEKRTFIWDFRLSQSKVRDGASTNIGSGSVDYTYGNVHIHLSENIPYSPTNIQGQLTTSSSWDKFEDDRVVGGVLGGYVLVNNGSTYDVFAKWDENSTKWSRAIVTHADFGWSAPYNFKRRLDFHTADPQTDSYDDRYGNLETLLQPYNTQTYDEYGGTATNNASREFSIYAKTTSGNPNSNGASFYMHGQNNVSDRVGNAKIFKASYSSTHVWPKTSSDTNPKFDNYKIKGGKYDGFVRVYGASNGAYRGYDLFMKWKFENNNFDVLLVTHGDFNWTGGEVIMYPDLWDGW